ncbi:MAG TPA: BON domain-containing protein [Cyclobacteriaceae bacterium]|nr:BON domain-containing protein [Cyclobacteriaceae bacterium]
MKSDNQIREDVLEEIRWDPQLAKIAHQIGVSVKDEVATLSGTVDYYYQRIAVQNAVQRVGGVKVVAVDINVDAETSDTITDSTIATAIRNALVWHSSVKEDLIDIRVDDGWVSLEGNVHWDYERKAAERAIENLRGVRGIINKIKIIPRGTESRDVKKKINAAFHRSATIDANNISVTVNGQEIELIGKVRSWAERTQAEAVALSMPGITEVKNKLEITTEILAD